MDKTGQGASAPNDKIKVTVCPPRNAEGYGQSEFYKQLDQLAREVPDNKWARYLSQWEQQG